VNEDTSINLSVLGLSILPLFLIFIFTKAWYDGNGNYKKIIRTYKSNLKNISEIQIQETLDFHKKRISDIEPLLCGSNWIYNNAHAPSEYKNKSQNELKLPLDQSKRYVEVIEAYQNNTHNLSH